MTKNEEKQMALKGDNLTPYRIIGMIAAVFATLAIFVGAVMWISTMMASNTVAIKALQEGQRRQDRLIDNNSQIIRQHAQVIAILEQQQNSIDILNEFMTQGGRFTAEDGKQLNMDLEKVKSQLLHYEVLEAELSWIKESLMNISSQMRTIEQKQDKVYEMHQGFAHGQHSAQ